MQEKEKLESELQNFKDVSIATIMEKDRELEELTNKYSPEMLEALLKERDQLCEENEEFKKRMLNMESDLESERVDNEEKRRVLENEVSAIEKYKEQLDRNKTYEASLIEELRRFDEKIQQLEKNEKKSEELLNEKRSEVEKLKRTIIANEGQNVMGEEIEKLVQKYDKKIEEISKENMTKEATLRLTVERIESENIELGRKCEGLEKEKVKVIENATALKIRIESMEDKMEREKKDFEEQMNEKLEEVVMEKERLEREMRKLMEELVI